MNERWRAHMNREPLRPITEDEVRSFRDDGIVCLRGLFGSDWIAHLRDAAERGLAEPGDLHVEVAAARGQRGRFFHDTFVWRRDPACRRFVFGSPAAEIAATLMAAARINIFFDQWLIKEPGTPTPTPWHHDLTYWPVDGDQICTLWLALDAVDAESGAVEYVKGSHRWGRRYRAATFSGIAQYKEPLPEVPDIDALRDGLEIASFALEPGDCTVHHGLLVHGAPGNRSPDRRRRAHVSRWAGDDAVFHPRPDIQEMPPLPDLAPGSPITSDLWPQVWPRGGRPMPSRNPSRR